MLTDERTNEQISAALAERLFGWEECKCTRLLGLPHFKRGNGVAHYDHVTARDLSEQFSDYNAALGLVVPEMRKLGYELRIEDELDRGVVNVQFSNGRVCGIAEQPFGLEPRAICLAAEAALDAERNTE